MCAYSSTSEAWAILDLAIAGRGVALLPEFLCIEALRDGRLKRVLRAYKTKPLPVHLVWSSNAKSQAKVLAFIELATAELPNFFGAI